MQFFKQIQNNLLLLSILITGFFCRVYAALADPFLHDWDERYHALVSRNMMEFPFKPMLNKVTLGEFDVNAWCCNHIWLHKQPLFMWQIAAFMKLFGVSTFTLRLPGVLMGTLMILIIYKIAMRTTQNKAVSIVSSLFMCFSLYQLNLISGRKGMDHNDVTFGFYVLCSFWAFFEYLHNPKVMKWIILTGFFAGCAVLNKWLTGILVFAPWGMITLYDFYETRKIREFKNICISFAVCLLIFLPWQFYIFYKFPVEALYEYRYNAQHIFRAVEDHAGDAFQYVNNFDTFFGRNIFIFLIIGFAAPFLQKKWRSKFHFSLIFSFLLVLIFFSFIVATKIDSYFFIVVPIGFIYASIGIEWLCTKMRISTYASICIALLIILYASTPYTFITDAKRIDHRTARIYNDSIYKNIKSIIPPDIKIVVNAFSPGQNDIMFYHNDITAFHFWIDEKYLRIFEKYKIKIATFADHAQNHNPQCMTDYPYIFIIPVTLKNIRQQEQFDSIE